MHNLPAQNSQIIHLQNMPQNETHFKELMKFFEVILNICKDLEIQPIVEASFAVFAYTEEPTLDVNDVDMLIPEDKFDSLVKEFKSKAFEYQIKDYHVLRVCRNGLKLEFDGMEYWTDQWEINIKNLSEYPLL